MSILNNLAPIIVFTYNRPDHTFETLEALRNNKLADQSTLYIFCDGPKVDSPQETLDKIKEVRQVVRQKQWCKKVNIIERVNNWGLTKNIVEGVTRISKQYGKVIVIEDDIVTSTGFLTFMNETLHLYAHDEKVMSVTGYMFPLENTKDLSNTFFASLTSPWGWGTWDRAWKHLNLDLSYLLKNIKDKKRFNMDGNYQFYYMLRQQLGGDWDLKWYASVFLQNGLCLFPKQSLVKNIGWDGSGIHCDDMPNKQNETHQLLEHIDVERLPIKEDFSYRKIIADYYKQTTPQQNKISRIKWDIIDFLDITFKINLSYANPLVEK